MIVTKGELHERSTLRYTIMALIVIGVIILSLVTRNRTGVILLVFLTGGYLFYSTFATERLQLSTDTQGIQLGDHRFLRDEFVGYVIEVDKNTELMRNLVLVRHNGHDIHTVPFSENDMETVKETLLAIDEHLPLLEGFAQTPVEIMMRKFKI